MVFEEQQRQGGQQGFMKRCAFVTHLHIIYKGLIADTKSLLAFNDCWIPDGQNKLLASLWKLRTHLECEAFVKQVPDVNASGFMSHSLTDLQCSAT